MWEWSTQMNTMNECFTDMDWQTVVEGGEEQGINGEREGREGKGNLAAGKTSAQRLSVQHTWIPQGYVLTHISSNIYACSHIHIQTEKQISLGQKRNRKPKGNVFFSNKEAFYNFQIKNMRNTLLQKRSLLFCNSIQCCFQLLTLALLSLIFAVQWHQNILTWRPEDSTQSKAKTKYLPVN